MREILSGLAPEAWVLDLGSSTGSFPDSLTAARVLRLDRDRIRGLGVQADAARLPFGDAVFDVVVANHSFEHFLEISMVLQEMGRVVKPAGAIFASVPDALTLTDRLYRWLAKGGGHVNAFTEPLELAGMIVEATGKPLSGMKVLHSSMAFLNRKNADWTRRCVLIGGGHEWTLQAGTYLFRWMDLVFGTRLSVYGWAYYFGTDAELDLVVASNVCVRCGSGHIADWLVACSLVHRWLIWNYYRCPCCGTANLFL
mgnify:CR=1 FL=1